MKKTTSLKMTKTTMKKRVGKKTVTTDRERNQSSVRADLRGRILFAASV